MSTNRNEKLKTMKLQHCLFLSKYLKAQSEIFNLNDEKRVVAHILDFYSNEFEKIKGRGCY